VAGTWEAAALRVTALPVAVVDLWVAAADLSAAVVGLWVVAGATGVAEVGVDIGDRVFTSVRDILTIIHMVTVMDMPRELAATMTLMVTGIRGPAPFHLTLTDIEGGAKG
jgi:hypothetical protein